MTRVTVTVAYGQAKIAAMVKALAEVDGGPGTVCQVHKDNTGVIVDFERDKEAEEFRTDIKSLIPTLAYVGSN